MHVTLCLSRVVDTKGCPAPALLAHPVYVLLTCTALDTCTALYPPTLTPTPMFGISKEWMTANDFMLWSTLCAKRQNRPCSGFQHHHRAGNLQLLSAGNVAGSYTAMHRTQQQPAPQQACQDQHPYHAGQHHHDQHPLCYRQSSVEHPQHQPHLSPHHHPNTAKPSTSTSTTNNNNAALQH